jgi:FkbM family methyltransferase
MTRTHAPSGWMYRTQDPESVHDKLWDWVSGSVGWDIGANEGQSTDRMLANGFERVIAVEPAIESFRILEREWGGDPRVTLLNIALSDEPGTVDLSVRSTPMGGGQLVSTEVPSDGWYGAELYRRCVLCMTIDQLLGAYGAPDFVKIDTEGFEERILRGAEAVRRSGCSWLIEVHSAELKEACYDLLDSRHVTMEIENPESPGNGWLLAERMLCAGSTWGPGVTS